MNKDMIDSVQDDWTEQRPDLDPEPMGVVLRIQALAKILGDQASESVEEFGLQWWQYDVLSTLRRQGEPFTLAASELAEAAMLTSGSMTNRINGLENAGLVQRREDPEDGRRVLVRLSQKGMRVIESATEARFESAMTALDSLDGNQRKMLSDLLRLVLRDQ